MFASVGDVSEFVGKCRELLNNSEKYDKQVLKIRKFISSPDRRFSFPVEFDN